jgi:2-dehydropantoate 2-reductase
MKFCIVGAGAIGGFVGVKLANAGHEVTFIARGKNLEAIRANGMKLVTQDGAETVARVHVTDNWQEAGKHDVVILALKAHQVAPIADKLHHLYAPHTTIVTMQNGIPFWYFAGLSGSHAGAHADKHVESVDPGGALLATIPAERIIGCVVYPASELVQPGVVVHIEGERFPLGELDGRKSERVEKIAAAFVEAGLKAPVLDAIRNEIWLKLWGNLTFNPISALTHATLVDICRHPHGRALAAQMMREAQAVAEKLGASFRVPLEKRIEGAEKVGKHKTSMLQDVEHGRAIEIDALVGAVVELGRLADVPTPTIAAIYNAAKLLSSVVENEEVGVRAFPLNEPYSSLSSLGEAQASATGGTGGGGAAAPSTRAAA